MKCEKTEIFGLPFSLSDRPDTMKNTEPRFVTLRKAGVLSVKTDNERGKMAQPRVRPAAR